MLTDTSCFLLDTLNSRAKVNYSSEAVQLQNIIRYEKPQALYRGFSAAFYGSLIYGYAYFYVYKQIKVGLRHYFESIGNIPLLYFCSAALSECLSLGFYYPLDLVKVRMQARHEQYKYKGTFDGFYRIYKEGKIMFYYKKSPCYVANSVTNYGL